MMRVRFLNGAVVEYPTANFADRLSGFTDLYTKKDGTWLAQVPSSSVVIEVGNVIARPIDLAEQLVRVLSDPTQRSLQSTAALATLKRQLAAFDARSRCWQESR